jgi:hypothetical protein
MVERMMHTDWRKNYARYAERLTAAYWHQHFSDGTLDENGQPNRQSAEKGVIEIGSQKREIPPAA